MVKKGNKNVVYGKKGKDVSNQTLAVLVLVGIGISLLGFLNAVSDGDKLTGMIPVNVTQNTSTTSFKILAVLFLNLTDASINLGDLGIGETNDSETRSDWFNITNDGTISFTVKAYGTASPFTSTSGGANLLPTNFYKVHTNFTQSGTANFTYINVPNSTAPHTLITGLAKNSGSDKAAFGISVTVPDNEDAGSKSANLVILAEP